MIASRVWNWSGILLLGVTGACSSSDDDEPAQQTAWTISSPAFQPGGLIPHDHTCEGRPFPVPGPGKGNPEINWTEGPPGTQSYALVMKHLAISEVQPPTSPTFFQGFMWAIWDIPAGVHQIPMNLSRDQFPGEIQGAQQWASWNQFGYFAPCPGFMLSPDMIAAGQRQVDDYGFELYALSTPKLALPPRPENVSNYTMTLYLHLESTPTINLGSIELKAKADAIPTEFKPPPPPPMYPEGVTVGPPMAMDMPTMP